MKLTRPHWLTAVAATIGAIGSAVLAANSFPAYQGVIAAIVGVCAVLAAPTVTSSPKVPS